MLVSSTVAVLLGVSCREPTSISIEARTNVAWRAGLVVGFTAGGVGTTEGLEPTTETREPWGGDGFIGTLTVIPESGDDGFVALKVVMGVRRETRACTPPQYEGCIVARRRVRYVPHERLRLPISLYAQCIDVACDADTTCNALGLCVSATSTCDGALCTVAGETAGDSGAVEVDASAADGSILDATTDSGARDSAADRTATSTSILCPTSRACVGPDERCCIDGQLQGVC